MKSALVTGCAGFIGSHLTEQLLKKEWDVYGIDNFHPYYSRELKEKNLDEFKNNNKFQFVNGSILELDDLKKIPKNIDYVFHIAAIAGVRNSLQNPSEYFKINFEGTKKIIDRFLNVKKIIFASTSSVYGEIPFNEFPVSETHSLNPISPYGESKKQAEELFVNAKDMNGLDFAILRFYTVYGPRQRPDEAFTKFIRLAFENKSIPIYGDGSKERDFTNINDIVNGSILATEKGSGIYNLGSGNPVTVNKMVSSIEKILGFKMKKEYIDSPLGDVQKTHADISKAKKELGFQPNIKLDEGIKKTIDWFKKSFVN
jgi:nucleoside-diphosphate-sugar epimerase